MRNFVRYQVSFPFPASGRALVAPLAVLLVLGCSREEIRQYRVAKAEPRPQTTPGPGAGSSLGVAPGMTGEVPPPPAVEKGLTWKLPSGWTEEKTGGMRYATLKPNLPGRVEVSVVVLPGPAGGELANVNRWRGQIGLPPLEEAALRSERKTTRARVGEVAVYDFTSEGQQKSRMITGLFTAQDGNTWFLKLTGDAEPVAKARPDFLRLMESLNLATP